MKVKLIFTKDQKVWPCREDQLGLPFVTEPQCAYRTEFKITFRGQEYDGERLHILYQDNPGFIYGLIGHHKGDEEGITFLRKAGVLEYVIFSVHSREQNYICKPSECLYDNEGYLLGFVAPNSNATYPVFGTHWRIFGFANDVTVQHGRVWKVEPIYESHTLASPKHVDYVISEQARFVYGWKKAWPGPILAVIFIPLALILITKYMQKK